MTQHTPAPWITGGCSGRMIRSRDSYLEDGFLADVYTKANAQFIVRAVNAHDALVEACETLVAGLKTHECQMCGYPWAEHHESCQVLAAQKALALAEVKS